jgi:hypothetical protein
MRGDLSRLGVLGKNYVSTVEFRGSTRLGQAWFIWFIWFVSFVWLNQMDQIDQISQMNKIGWRDGSASH